MIFLLQFMCPGVKVDTKRRNSGVPTTGVG